MKNLKFISLLFPIIFCFTAGKHTSSAQELVFSQKYEQNLSAASSLSEYISIALKKSPGLQSAYNKWMAKVERSEQAGTMPEPELSYMVPLNKMAADLVYEKQRITISQMFPWFGKLSLEERIAVFEAHAENYLFEMYKRELIYKVIKAYYEYYYIGKAIENTQQNIHLMTYLEEVTRTRYAAAQAEFGDLLKLQLEIEKMKNELKNLENQLPVYSDRLSAEIGLTPGSNLPVPTDFNRREFNKDLKMTVFNAVENNPSLKMLDSMIDAAEAMKSRAGREYFPDIMVSLEYRDMGSREAPSMQDLTDSIMLMFTISLPVKLNKYSSMAAEATYIIASLEMNRKEELNRLSVLLRQALFMLDESERRLELYNKSLLPKARETVNVAMEDFIGGKSELMKFIDAVRMQLEMELLLQRAKADREIAVAEIEMLVGELRPDAKSGNDNYEK